MDKPSFSKVSDILSRASFASQSITIEEGKYQNAMQNRETNEQIDAITNKINILKRKHALLSQAAEMRKEKDRFQ